ncbi:MAG: hypothetical protein U0452_01230 [Anaerolineae bacterium]
MHHKRRGALAVALLAGCLSAFGGFGLALAQGIGTPTPAPTKTGVPAATPVATITSSNDGSVPFEPLTQNDLTLLTGNVQRPNGLAWYNNFLYTACSGDGTVYEIQSETGETRTYIWGVSNAHTLYVEEEDDTLQMWVPDYGDNRIELVTRNGIDPITDAVFDGPWGIVKEDDQHFLVSNLLGGRVDRVSRDGDVELALDGLASPAGLALDDSVLYVANNGSTRRAIEWYNRETGDAGPLVSGLQNTTGLQLADDGYLYFAYALGTRGLVGRVSPQVCAEAGGCTNDQVEVVLYTDLETPLAGLAVTPDGRLFIHTMFNPALYWVRIPDWPLGS